MRKLYLFLALLLSGALLAASAPRCRAELSRQELREAYRLLESAPEGSLYLENPSTADPYSPGALTEEALADAIAYLNFLRSLAGLEAPVSLDDNLSAICQHGAVLLSALERVDHHPESPEDMPEDFYRVASYAAASSNLAGLSWMRGDILRSAIEYFARDDGEQNLTALGHRRWLLNPAMGATGFGLANSASGMSYALMFAHDLTGGEPWREICWPAPGAFPAELMRSELAWSVTLNPECYDLAASSPSVHMTELSTGTEYDFPYPAGVYPDGYFSINQDAYGSGPCLIFKPDLGKAGLEEYFQNQIWKVRVSGLVDAYGQPAELSYTTEMAALHPIDPASVEISPLALTLSTGETAALAAAVIPSWADDLSVSWSSDDEAVARVDAQGTVTAVAPGECRIVARSVNGRQDACALTVIP